MARLQDTIAGLGTLQANARPSAWQLSWPLLVGIYVFGMALYDGHFLQLMLIDGDTYWHIAAGQWILEHAAVPAYDPFSHSMHGAPWTAQEWLSEVLLARAHDLGGWSGVVAVTGACFASAFALLTRALLRTMEPLRALLFATLAVMLAVGHLLARPFVLAMPLLMVWVIELVRASDERRTPGLWLLPVMTLWANLHGGFTLGIALAFAFAFEALLEARGSGRMPEVMRSWGFFLLLAVGSALLTPHGVQAFWFTWQVLAQDTYALDRIGEWASPNFHSYQPLEVWLLGGLALVLHQGLRLPPVRLVLLLGLLHLGLKHVRNVELLGLIGPLVVAAPFAAQWRELERGKRASGPGKDHVLPSKLARPAGFATCVAAVLVMAGASLTLSRVHPVELPEFTVPAKALAAARAAGVKGPVLNDYGWGGYLIYSGIPPFIDGRSDMYRDAFMRRHFDAVELASPGSLEQLLEQYGITWTLLRPGTPAIALLDRSPGWRRIYADKTAVVHSKVDP